ncbi:MAG: hypothetical protein HZA90_17085 [Verrucomicrobia bacterium]|nr:hypothetical protein [Verrucomicrobiota bacterium]
MKWPEPIRFSQPLREVKLIASTTEQWEQRLREHEQAAYERGLIMGERALSQELLDLRSQVSELQQGLLAALRNAVPQVVKDTESNLIALALEAARKLVANMPITGKMVEAVVREALDQVEEATEFHIDLHKDDLALLKRVKSPLLAPEPGGDPVHFHVSPEVSRGGCLVHTRFGTLDARRETKLKQLEQTLSA